jgi:uncharacterized protein YecE (DUF72 family)
VAVLSPKAVKAPRGGLARRTGHGRGRAYVGTTGWNHDAWRDAFYGRRPKSQWLSLCAQRFSGIEVDATFHRLQRRETFQRWRAQTPPDFCFAIRANRYLTHNKKLLEPLSAVVLERSRASGLGAKLAVVLWQLPRTLYRNLVKLEDFARALHRWRGVRHAVEFRHESWFEPDVAACLKRHRIAVCQSVAADWPMWQAVTTDLVYVRLDGHAATAASGYSEAQLRTWARRVRRWQREGREVHVYFESDASGHAPANALRLIELINRR